MLRPRRFWRPRLFRPRLRGWGCGIIGLILLMCILGMFALRIFLLHP